MLYAPNRRKRWQNQRGHRARRIARETRAVEPFVGVEAWKIRPWHGWP